MSKKTQINKLLIANRGEIACRIARAARACSIEPVGVHSAGDATALHVREIGQSYFVGETPASESYLRIDTVLDAAKKAGVDAIHPGYGFLAENAEFARAVEDAGIIFVGPTPQTLETFGDKASAKQAAVAASVPVISGSKTAFSDIVTIAAKVREMGFPVLLKAVGGGGGRGQRLVENEDTLARDIEAALREAKSAFGSGGLLLERMISDARHIEIQIAGDGNGDVVHLYERDCSLQRRHQKVIEEAPAFGLSRNLLDKIADDAVRLGKSLNYRGLGTVEFLVSGNEYFFLEVNPRIQVEHPVTEAVTGIDLVQLHLAIAAGEGMGISQPDISLNGHAFEARIYAETPANNFAPSTGEITALVLPDSIRVDSGVEAGDVVSPFYDPMIAKLIVHRPTRQEALVALGKAIGKSDIAGVDTNLDFLANLVENDSVKRMQHHTRWIDQHIDELVVSDDAQDFALVASVAATLHVMSNRQAADTHTWKRRDLFTGWRLGLGDQSLIVGSALRVTYNGQSREVRISPADCHGKFIAIVDGYQPLSLHLRELGGNRWHLEYDGQVLIIIAQCCSGVIEITMPGETSIVKIAPLLSTSSVNLAAEGTLESPLTGLIVKVMVSEDDDVSAGETIAILESMKMEIPIKSVLSGTVTKLMVREGDMVDRGQIISEIIAEKES